MLGTAIPSADGAWGPVIASLAGLLAVVLAGAAKIAKRSFDKVFDEIKSPNGVTTGNAIHEVSKKVDQLGARQSKMETRMKRVEEKVGIAGAASRAATRESITSRTKRGRR